MKISDLEDLVNRIENLLPGVLDTIEDHFEGNEETLKRLRDRLGWMAVLLDEQIQYRELGSCQDCPENGQNGLSELEESDGGVSAGLSLEALRTATRDVSEGELAWSRKRTVCLQGSLSEKSSDGQVEEAQADLGSTAKIVRRPLGERSR